MQPTKIICINTLHSINKIVHFVKNNPRSSMASETSSPVNETSGPWNDQLLLEEFRKALLVEHNKQRQDHGSGELILTDDLNNYAQEWAALLAEMEVATHRPNPTFGENLHKCYWGDTTIDEMAKTICDDFYDEIVLYDFDLAEYVCDAAHFTQLVWYDTSEMGVGMAVDTSGFAYCVVNYAPRGNMQGGFKSNVLPLGTIYEPRPELKDCSKFIPPPVTTGPKGHCINRFRKLIINQHNIYRKLHSATFLEGADYLHEIAQKWAEHLAETNVFDHSNNGYGESIFTFHSTSDKEYPGPIEICKSFKQGVENYAYDEAEKNYLPHFTQMVWKNSKEIGVGIKKADNGTVYVVCNYNPEGNIEGEYASNVARPQTKKFKPIKVIV